MVNIKKEIPGMPEHMRKTVEQEVARQIAEDRTTVIRPLVHSRKGISRRIAVAAMAATLALGATVFAGEAIRSIQSKRNGTYGVDTVVTGTETGGYRDGKITEIELLFHYIPDGMIQSEDDGNKLYYQGHEYLGGISADCVRMDVGLGVESVMTDLYVADNENRMIAGHEAVYLEMKKGIYDTRDGFDKKLYIMYPEVSRVLEIFGGIDLAKDELIKTAENIELKETGRWIEADTLTSWNDIAHPQTEGLIAEQRSTASKEEIAETKKPGETIYPALSAETADGTYTTTGDVAVTVRKVTVKDDLSELTRRDMIPEEWLSLIDESGKLTRSERSYVKRGDGITSDDQVLQREDIALKIVEAELTYENTGDEDLENILFFNSLLVLTGEDGSYRLSSQPGTHDLWDEILYPGYRTAGEMGYYDTTGEEGRNNGSNYIPGLTAGESVTVHMAWLVAEDELPGLFLNIEGGAYEFDSEDVTERFVDIRQL